MGQFEDFSIDRERKEWDIELGKVCREIRIFRVRETTGLSNQDGIFYFVLVSVSIDSTSPRACNYRGRVHAELGQLKLVSYNFRITAVIQPRSSISLHVTGLL